MIKSDNLLITPTDKKAVWSAPWTVELRKEDKKQIGTVQFEGAAEKGAVSIHLELDEDYRNKGYGTEVLKEMVHWAFLHRDIYSVTAEVDHDNDKGVHALEKAGFVIRENEGKTEHYSVVKAKTTWLGVYIVIGINVGMILGIIFNNAGLGLAIGLVGCMGIGNAMDYKEMLHRKEITGVAKYHKRYGKQ